jgi:hypothetical protein
VGAVSVLKPEHWIALGTWILAFATMILAFATVGLVLDTKYSSQRQLRAYVYASPYRAFNIDDRHNIAQIYTTIGSKGSTFAHNVERSAGINLLAGPVPVRFSDLGPLKRIEGKLDIPPRGETFVIQNFRALTSNELAGLMTTEGILRLYAFGRITYTDEFGYAHSTTFCHAYFGPERLPIDGGFAYESWQAKYCDRHNETDPGPAQGATTGRFKSPMAR